jgi:hypothetical protein
VEELLRIQTNHVYYTKRHRLLVKHDVVGDLQPMRRPTDRKKKEKKKKKKNLLEKLVAASDSSYRHAERNQHSFRPAGWAGEVALPGCWCWCWLGAAATALDGILDVGHLKQHGSATWF